MASGTFNRKSVEQAAQDLSSEIWNAATVLAAKKQAAALRQAAARDNKNQKKIDKTDDPVKKAKIEAKYRDKQAKKENKQKEKDRKKEEKEKNASLLRERELQKKSLRERIQISIDARKEEALEALENATTAGEKLKAAGKYAGAAIGEAAVESLGNVTGAIAGAFGGVVDKYLGAYTEYMGAIDARIQGAFAGKGYEELESAIRNQTNGNPYVLYTDVMGNLNTLVQEGTAVNLTQRAFLMSVSEKIATTFDATDSTLMRLIRIQRNDTTAARLGMEAELTKLFNYYFSDTSYLSQAFDSVAAALTDLSAQLGATGSVEFEYIIQKWLGTLGSSGVDEGTLTNIASAINALGTGQIDYLTSNSEMQNLLVMAANRMGLSYSDMLIEGINSIDVNKLMYGVIAYLQDVVSGANNVVKAQYAQIFGFTMADISALEKISESTLKSIYNSAMTYDNAIQAVTEQLQLVSSRTHLSEKIDNAIENVLISTGVGIASSAGLYGTYKAFDMLESLTGGIHIPTISVLGSGITLPDSIESMAKSVIIGIGAVGSLIGAVGNWAEGSALSLSKWTVDAGWSKGSYSGFTGTDQLQAGKSSTGFVSNADSTGMQQSMYDEQSKSAEDISGEKQADESESEMVITLKALLKYFQEDGGSSTNPLRVQVVTPARAPGATTPSTDQELTLYDLLKAIKEKFDNMPEGILEDPIHVRMQTLTTGNQFQVGTGGYLP